MVTANRVNNLYKLDTCHHCTHMMRKIKIEERRESQYLEYKLDENMRVNVEDNNLEQNSVEEYEDPCTENATEERKEENDEEIMQNNESQKTLNSENENSAIKNEEEENTNNEETALLEIEGEENATRKENGSKEIEDEENNTFLQNSCFKSTQKIIYNQPIRRFETLRQKTKSEELRSNKKTGIWEIVQRQTNKNIVNVKRMTWILISLGISF